MEGWRKINGIARTKIDERKTSMATKSKVSKIRESEKKRKREFPRELQEERDGKREQKRGARSLWGKRSTLNNVSRYPLRG